MIKKEYIIVILLGLSSIGLSQEKSITLSKCFQIATKNNIALQQMNQSVQTREYNYKASKLSYLPKIDISGGYTYLSRPLSINLGTVKDGIVNGTSQQNVNTANSLYQEITGNNLSNNAQHAIYESSKNIIGNLYPDYNPELSRQQYFKLGANLRLPIYMGGKRNAARKIAGNRVNTAKINLHRTQNTIDYAIVTQYIKILYLNSIATRQKELVHLYQSSKRNAEKLVEQEIIPPYQSHWANIALTQAKTDLSTVQLEKENGLSTLQNIMGTDSTFQLMDTLKIIPILVNHTQYNINQNLGVQFLQAKSTTSKSTIKLSQSLSLPNIYAVGNYQILQSQLPVFTPPWMIGIGIHWNIFSFFENHQRVKAAKSFTKETQLMVQQEQKNLQNNLMIVRRKIKALRLQMKTLDQARKEAKLTSKMVQKRFANQLSSVKDVNDALKMLKEAEKAYYTSILNYDLAVATYFKITGHPQEVTKYLR